MSTVCCLWRCLTPLCPMMLIVTWCRTVVRVEWTWVRRFVFPVNETIHLSAGSPSRLEFLSLGTVDCLGGMTLVVRSCCAPLRCLAASRPHASASCIPMLWQSEFPPDVAEHPLRGKSLVLISAESHRSRFAKEMNLNIFGMRRVYMPSKIPIERGKGSQSKGDG